MKDKLKHIKKSVISLGVGVLSILILIAIIWMILGFPSTDLYIKSIAFCVPYISFVIGALNVDRINELSKKNNWWSIIKIVLYFIIIPLYFALILDCVFLFFDIFNLPFSNIIDYTLTNLLGIKKSYFSPIFFVIRFFLIYPIVFGRIRKELVQGYESINSSIKNNIAYDNLSIQFGSYIFIVAITKFTDSIKRCLLQILHFIYFYFCFFTKSPLKALYYLLLILVFISSLIMIILSIISAFKLMINPN